MPGHVPIYLTFDDGVETEAAQGERGPTLDVLGLLDKRGITATFFVHGRNTSDAGTVLARMLRAGHHVGNHLFHQGGATLDMQPAFLSGPALSANGDTHPRSARPVPRCPGALPGAAPCSGVRRGYDSAGNLFLLAGSGTGNRSCDPRWPPIATCWTGCAVSTTTAAGISTPAAAGQYADPDRVVWRH